MAAALISVVSIYPPTISVVSHIAFDTALSNARDPNAGFPVISVVQATVFCDANAHTPDSEPMSIAPALIRLVLMYPPTITVVSSNASDTRF